MALKSARSRQSRRSARLDFAGLEIIGALLTPDIVARIAAFEANDQSEEGYDIPAGLKLRDEIARYYRIGEALWSRFRAASIQNSGASERFVVDLLRQCFGFDSIAPQPVVRLGEREFPVRYAALSGRVPIVIAPVPAGGARRSGIDESLPQFGDSSRRRSATLLLQEYLNAKGDARWGLVSDGLTLRLMRDNISLTRPAWIEANIAKIFSEGLFPDFSALWLLIHQSRFGQRDVAGSDCVLERWRDRGRTDGVAARDKLRQGVESALLELGQGFIEHTANGRLRQSLTEGTLTVQGYYEELLRLIYRLIFLFAAEDRGLLHPPSAPVFAPKIYADGYSLSRLRERSMRRAAWDRHGDSWEGLKSTFAALRRGETKLGLPALGGLFADGVLADLECSKIENRRFLAALWRLAWLRPDGQPITRVNWRDMETEELGSVYESLLELTPRASADRRTFDFAEGDETKGNARKTSGSYYTPDALVKLLLDSTLDPILDAAESRNSADAAAEILKLSIIDPACGSGHFLLGAARRAAARIAKLRSPGAPSQAEFQHALREVVAHCIYGTDRNPMAVELCKVALWIEALDPGKPLTFLDNHIRCGDSLVGVFDYETLRRGIPDEAYKPLTGDDKDVAKAYAKHNKNMREGHGTKGGLLQELKPPAEIIDAARALIDLPEDTLEQIAVKRLAFERMHASNSWRSLHSACDCFVAAFFAPKTGKAPTAAELARTDMPLTDHVWAAVRGQAIPAQVAEAAAAIARRISTFHWPLEFPHVFARGGFDVIAGNPPWERIKLQEQEFFAARSPEIATAQNKAARDRLIKSLEKADPNSPDGRLLTDFKFAKRSAEATSEFARNSGRYPLTGAGDVNTYALFAEHFSNLARTEGRAGVIVPTGIATDSSTSAFFGNLVSKKRLAGLTDFENREKLFPAVDSRMKFCVLAMGAAERANFAFFLTNATQLDEVERKFTLTADEIARINPNTKTAPVFRARADAELTAKLYGRAPVLIEERSADQGGDVNPWGITFHTRVWHMAEDSQWFLTREALVSSDWHGEGAFWKKDGERCAPLYEGKMVHLFDHRWGTFEGDDEESGIRDVLLREKNDPNFEPTPRYWVPEKEISIRIARVPTRLKSAYRKTDAVGCLKVLAEWVVGTIEELDPTNPVKAARAAEARLMKVFGNQALTPDIIGRSFANWLGNTAIRAVALNRETPLTFEDLKIMASGSNDLMKLTHALIVQKTPRWLMGWRDITNTTNERTVISAIIPAFANSDKFLIMYPVASPQLCAALLSNLSSIPLDFVARQKFGG